MCKVTRLSPSLFLKLRPFALGAFLFEQCSLPLRRSNRSGADLTTFARRRDRQIFRQDADFANKFTDVFARYDISKLPEELRRSLTWDQGKEMHAHKRFTVATNVQVYFCDRAVPGSAA